MIPYVVLVDPYEKQEKTKIKVKLPNETSYQMAPVHVGIDEDYVNHINMIAMMQLIQQNELKSDAEKAFRVVLDTRDKLGSLYKKLNMSKFNQEKEDLNKQIKQKANKEALVEIVKAYKLFTSTLLAKLVLSGTRLFKKCTRRILRLQ